MSRKTVIVLLTVLALMVGVSLVAAQTLPGTGWLSGQQIQNVGTSPATIVFTAYDANGNPFNCGSQTAQPGASVNYLTTACSVNAGFIGSAVVSADQPIAAIVNVANNPTGRAGGMYRGTDGSQVNQNVAFPLVKSNFNGRTTTLYIQNAGGSANNISVQFKMNNGQTYNKAYNNVPVNAMIVVSTTDAGVPSQVFGSATATGTGALAGTALEHQVSAAVADNLQAYTAFTPNSYDDILNCPLVRNGHTAADQTTGIQVQNVGGSAQQIRVTYSYRIGSGSLQTKTVTSGTIQPGNSANFFGKDATLGMPAGALGAAKIQGLSGGNIAAIVNDVGYKVNPQRQTAYTCFADSAKTVKVALPLYKEFFNGNTSGIQVQNVGNASATVTVAYTDTNKGKTTVTYRNTQPLAAGASFTFFGVSSPSSAVTVVSGTPANLLGSYGGVVITSTQPVVAIVNESPGGGSPSNQDAKLYEGFNQ